MQVRTQPNIRASLVNSAAVRCAGGVSIAARNCSPRSRACTSLLILRTSTTCAIRAAARFTFKIVTNIPVEKCGAASTTTGASSFDFCTVCRFLPVLLPSLPWFADGVAMPVILAVGVCFVLELQVDAAISKPRRQHTTSKRFSATTRSPRGKREPHGFPSSHATGLDCISSMRFG